MLIDLEIFSFYSSSIIASRIFYTAQLIIYALIDAYSLDFLLVDNHKKERVSVVVHL
jgi:hypothetical protein